MSDAGFSTTQLCAIAGISVRQAEYWDRIELLSPSLCQASGSGSRRRWSERDVLVAACVKTLLDSGQSLVQWRPVIRGLTMLLRSPDDMVGHLVVRTNGAVAHVDEYTLLDLLNAGAVSFVLSLSRIAERVSTVATPFSADRANPPAPVAGRGIGVVEPTAVGANVLRGHPEARPTSAP